MPKIILMLSGILAGKMQISHADENLANTGKQ
jgi:hypothetical protein